jgi:hypothetical protein
MNVSRWIINYIIRPPLLLVQFVVSPILDLMFGWVGWLFAIHNERKLRTLVRDTHPFLFTKYHAKIVPNKGVPFPPAFDYAFVTVAVGKVLVRFCEGRGELDVRLASTEAPGEWHELTLVISLATRQAELQRGGVSNLKHAASLLAKYIDHIQSLFETDHTIKQRLNEIYAHDRITTRELEWEINKHLRR